MATLDCNILPVLTSKSAPPPLFDGTSRLYVSLICPYAQRAYVARNYKGLNDIQIVPIDLQDRPDWYKEKVYPRNKVPSLEHNGQVKGESLDLLEYLDQNFEGPKLYPSDPEKKYAAEELLKVVDEFDALGFSALKNSEANIAKEFGPALDRLENCLGKFNEGPFFLGNFSVVDCAYAPFLERFQISLLHFKNFDILAGRPKLAKYFEELNKLDVYSNTKANPKDIISAFKAKFNLQG